MHETLVNRACDDYNALQRNLLRSIEDGQIDEHRIHGIIQNRKIKMLDTEMACNPRTVEETGVLIKNLEILYLGKNSESPYTRFSVLWELAKKP